MSLQGGSKAILDGGLQDLSRTLRQALLRRGVFQARLGLEQWLDLVMCSI